MPSRMETPANGARILHLQSAAGEAAHLHVGWIVDV